MTGNTTARAGMVPGAASHEDLDWHAINWRRANEIVRRLQARIAKATQAGRWGKVQALQHLLTHSLSGKAIAVRRVTENRGKRTAGVDGTTWDTPEKKARAVGDLRRRGYQPRPLKRVYIPQSTGKKRPLGIPTMRDRAMQALYLLALNPIAETTADPHSYGFRLERCTADALVQCHTVLARRHGAEWILEADITSCFDRIDHNWLLDNIPLDKSILRTWLKAGFMERHVLYPTDEGTPQGGIISPVLANMTLDGLERTLREKYPQGSRTGRRAKVNLVRYADDFVVTGSSKELLEHEVKPLVGNFLRDRGLELSPEKTIVTHIEDGFDFLGQKVRKYRNGKVLTLPSKKNVHAFLGKVRGIIEQNKGTPAGELICQLNPVIAGWATYHRFGASKATFNKVDHAIFRKLWQWIRRRHPRKNAHWRKEKYFSSQGGRNWVFTGERKGEAGRRYLVRLHQAAATPIKRHRLIRRDANPFDPDWEPYFEERLGVKMATDLQGRRTLLYLWKRQNGLCAHCRQKITKITGWHNHHRVWRSLGGSAGADNRELLHPTCHMQLHSRENTIPVPRPIGTFEKA